MIKQNIYRGIVSSNLRTGNLLNFYHNVGDESGKNTYYLSIGKTTPWSDNEDDPQFAPPYPDDDITGVVDVWSNMIGISKIPREMMDAVIPRRDWGDERYDNPRTFHIGDIVVVNTAPYNRTEFGSGWMVYKVINVPDIGGCSIESIKDKDTCIKIGGEWTPEIKSVNPPIGRGDGIETGDGYVWEYLYTIPSDVYINKCTNEYIVVPFPDELEKNPEKWGYEHVITWYPNDYNLIYRVKVNSIRFRSYVDAMYFPLTTLPGNKGFRQVNIIQNPTAKGTVDKLTEQFYSADSVEPHSGQIIYFENRQPIKRSPDQTEEVNLIFEF